MAMRAVSGSAVLAAALVLGAAGAVDATECGDQIKVLDQVYGVGDSPAPVEATSQTGTMPTRNPAPTAAISTVPNTGGVAPSGGTSLPPGDLDRLRQALTEARAADGAGDATGCAAHLAEARRLTAGPDGDTGAPANQGGNPRSNPGGGG